MAVTTVLMGSTLFASMVDLIMSPVFHHFPQLKVCYSEGQIGWMPFALQRMDQVWEHYRFYRIENSINADIRPSDLFRGHVFGCFIDDQVGVDMRAHIGVENILWESDYPHADSVFPDSRTSLEKMLENVSDTDARRIAETNARNLFNFH
jgi:predicted TIM-barrel fold metal-dependent hydrolase